MRKVRAEQGFTLTELLISVVIIAIGVVGFATAVGLASTELWRGQRDTELSMLVMDQAERLKALPYNLVQAGTRTEGDYVIRWVVEGADPKRVTLEALYLHRRGRPVADTIVVYSHR
ncbi:MAG: prepilin-type N-terminal cleavage/methylation domain-containing protein [Gemmatimonadota bacterium]|nr:MAG: prepilin-type N-terminal cleavage/methylation domain-containing protein [Gemmatimonadota bacterium]